LTPWFTTSYIWLLNLFGFFHTIIIIHYDVLDWHINFMPIFLFCLLIKLVCTNEISSMSSSSLLFKIAPCFSRLHAKEVKHHDTRVVHHVSLLPTLWSLFHLCNLHRLLKWNMP
jgi:hypothetical protein